MKTSGVVAAALASVTVVEAFLTAPLLGNPSSVALHQSRTTCVSSSTTNSRSRSTAQYMVAAPAKEGTVAAVPHGGTLVDLNVKTEDEKKVRRESRPQAAALLFSDPSTGKGCVYVGRVMMMLQPNVRIELTDHTTPVYRAHFHVPSTLPSHVWLLFVSLQHLVQQQYIAAC